MTNRDRGRGEVFGSHLSDAVSDMQGVIDALTMQPEAVSLLEDHELLAVSGWTEGSNQVIRPECRRRAEKLRLFSSYVGKDD